MPKRIVSKHRAFLAAFKITANLTKAAKAAKVDRQDHYTWLKTVAGYPELFAQAQIEAGQTLEDDAVEWARKGLFEPLVYQGTFCYASRNVTLCLLPDGREVREDKLPKPIAAVEVISRRTIVEEYGPPLGIYRRSEGLMGRLLKAFMPARYGERGQLELTGAGGGPIAVSIAEVLRERRAKREGAEVEKL